ncbi:MAG: hypothetical protein AB7F86_09740 [Bdellovibrionales bacterium]
MKVGFRFWLRVAVMAVAFVGSVFAIQRLRVTDKAEKANLCPTRVTWLKTADGVVVAQDGLNWIRKENGQAVELDPIATEKWFSQHCRLTVEAKTPVPESKAEIFLTLSYVAGPPVHLRKTDDEVYIWKDLFFRSSQVPEAIEALKTLPIRTRPGQGSR